MIYDPELAATRSEAFLVAEAVNTELYGPRASDVAPMRLVLAAQLCLTAYRYHRVKPQRPARVLSIVRRLGSSMMF